MYLNNHSLFSLRYGTLSEEQLLQMAKTEGCECFVLTDINNTSACLNFIRKAPEYGIRPVLGIDFRNGNNQQYVCLAKNNEGFLELNNFLSKHLHQKKPFPKVAPIFEHCLVIYPFERLLHIEKLTFSDHEFIKNLKIIRKKKICKKEHLIIIHRESNSSEELEEFLNILFLKKYGRSKIIFGTFS